MTNVMLIWHILHHVSTFPYTVTHIYILTGREPVSVTFTFETNIMPMIKLHK